MFGKERVKQERIDTRDPEVDERNLAEAAGRATARVLINFLDEYVFKEETGRKEDSFFQNLFKFHSEAEARGDLDNQEKFFRASREYEDRMEEITDAQERKALTESFEVFKKEWEKQAKREMEDREIRDKRIALWRRRFGV